MSEPGWKRNGRNGPFDWWLGCKDHGYEYQRGCMSCGMAEDHNIEFQQKLERERTACDGVPRPVNPPEFQEATWGIDSVMRPCKSMAISEYAFRQWAKDVGIVLADGVDISCGGRP